MLSLFGFMGVASLAGILYCSPSAISSANKGKCNISEWFVLSILVLVVGGSVLGLFGYVTGKVLNFLLG